MCRAGTLSPPDGEGCTAQESRGPRNEQLEKEFFLFFTLAPLACLASQGCAISQCQQRWERLILLRLKEWR